MDLIKMRVYAWLGIWQEQIPAEAAFALKRMLGPLDGGEDEMNLEPMPTSKRSEGLPSSFKPPAEIKGCKRGTSWKDTNGFAWPHVHDSVTNVCLFCGDGSPIPPPEAFEKKQEGVRYETVGCGEHGSHRLEIRPDGSYDKPDCETFQ